jgi:hypothetical protein
MLKFRDYQNQVEAAVDAYVGTISPQAAQSQYLAVLKQHTKRTQGSLVLFGYELEDGKDTAMILRAALAVEMFHAYVQCMDQGVDIDQALRAAHEAEIILANLETDAENRLKVVSITNRTMMLAVLARNPEAKKEDVLHWRATELALNPIHVGQVLAGADCTRTNAVTDAALTFGEKLVNQDEVALENFLNSSL